MISTVDDTTRWDRCCMVHVSPIFVTEPFKRIISESVPKPAYVPPGLVDLPGKTSVVDAFGKALMVSHPFAKTLTCCQFFHSIANTRMNPEALHSFANGCDGCNGCNGWALVLHSFANSMKAEV